MNKKISIAFIGAGRVAASLVPALIKQGYNISHVLSRKKKSAEKIALRNHISSFSDNLNVLKEFKGIVFLSVPDMSVHSLSKELSSLKLNFKELIFIHLSGALDLSVLKPLASKGSLTGSMHIMQSFPLMKKVSIRDCYTAIETDNPSLKEDLMDLARTIKLKPFSINDKEKISYHIAAVYASNFINALMYAASDLCRDIKELPDSFFDVLEPIIKSVLFNIKKAGAVNALSGPVERGDYETIKKHLQLLKKRNKKLLNSYSSLSLLLLNAADEKHADSGKKIPERDKIKKLLKKELCK